MDYGKGRVLARTLAVALLLLMGWLGTRVRGHGEVPEVPKSVEYFSAGYGLELRVGKLSWPSVVQDRRIIGPICPAPEGGLIVAMHEESWASESLGGQSFGPCSLWWIDLNDRQKYGAGDLWLMPHIESDVPFTEVRDMASSEQAVWVGTDKGMLRVTNRKAELFEPTVLPSGGHMPLIGQGFGGVTDVEVDADGWVWVIPGPCVFHSSRAHTEQRAYSVRGVWWPADLSASPHVQGVWLLATKENGESTVTQLKPDSQSVEDESNVPLRTLAPDVLERGPELGISRIHIEADPKGRLWIAGQNQTGVHIFVCQEDALQEQTGFEKLLGGSRINDIVAGDDGKVYFATDGVGVLVFDGQQWQSHPVNEHLPHLLGSNLKPVNYVLPIPDGRLAVCTGHYLLIWDEGK
jgi:hypothetical protein